LSTILLRIVTGIVLYYEGTGAEKLSTFFHRNQKIPWVPG